MSFLFSSYPLIPGIVMPGKLSERVTSPLFYNKLSYSNGVTSKWAELRILQ